MEAEECIEVVEASVIDPEVVVVIRRLRERGWGARRIARELELDRKTVRRWFEGPVNRRQRRPRARRLDDEGAAVARELFAGVAQGNAVVVRDELRQRGYAVGLRTVQRVVADARREQLAADVATVRFETAPGEQMQVDFGQKRVVIGGVDVVVHLMAAVLGFSRRIFVKAFLSERAEDWRDGIATAFRHFGGVTRELLVDNTRCLVLRHDVEAGVVELNHALVEMCKDFGCSVRACRPYRARTKGKIENGVKYVKRNALAGRSFASFAELERHLATWMAHADERVHGTTHERPTARFEAERQALLPLPSQVRVRGERRLRRRVSNDAFVDVDTVRYSVPVEYVRRTVEVMLREDRVVVFCSGVPIAEHARSNEPRRIVEDINHRSGLYRSSSTTPSTNELARPLSDYADVVEGAALPRPSGLAATDSPSIPERIDDEVRGLVGGAP